MHFEFNLQCLVRIGRKSWDTNTSNSGLKKNHKILNAKVKIQHRLLTWRVFGHASFILVDPNSCLLIAFFETFTLSLTRLYFVDHSLYIWNELCIFKHVCLKGLSIKHLRVSGKKNKCLLNQVRLHLFSLCTLRVMLSKFANLLLFLFRGAVWGFHHPKGQPQLPRTSGV